MTQQIAGSAGLPKRCDIAREQSPPFVYGKWKFIQSDLRITLQFLADFEIMQGGSAKFMNSVDAHVSLQLHRPKA
jgi:hypothetical protein